MEEPYSLIVAAICVTFFSIYGWRILNWVWVRPKKLEKSLREQGLNGNSYKLFVGDMKEMSMMNDEANSKPISFTNDITPRIIPFINKTIGKYGRNSFSWFGPTPALFITESEVIREILSKNYIYQKAPPTPLTKLLAQGVAVYETEKWAKHRKLVNPAFHLEKLKHMVPAFDASCSEMLTKWERIVSTGKASCEVDVWPHLQTLTSDAISRTAFGSNYEEGKNIFELQKEQAELILQVAQSIYIPGWRFLPTKMNKRIKKFSEQVNSSIMEIIKKRMDAIKAGAITDDLLGILLESNNLEIQRHGDKSVGMSMEDVIEECKMFYLVGQETTSSLLVWTLILLSNHLDWQELARQEVLTIFGTNKPDYEHLNHLKIMSMVLNEILRLYSPGVILARMTTKESKLGGISLPAGVHLLMPIILLHHDTKIWGEDAMEFKPERFRDGVPKAAKSHFFPFGYGPRTCIGQNFALLEAKMAIAMILQRFSFKLSPSYAHAPFSGLNLQPQFGAQLILEMLEYFNKK